MTSIPVLRVEPGVTFDRVAPADARMIAALDAATNVLGFDLWISSGTEGHGPRSPHTEGEAYDDETAMVLSRSPCDVRRHI
jgi:hypothetical protein